uniref:Glycoside hydrolase putative n=1 Tax=Albugo laibachii Nc14 TaxID=890382 RepID=F0W1Y5_9STRA|nr:glycoside hydrolase putative [Albugo laibachii Nc14]|eukprot:CCA15064.1 glycoside hydrolase putative [Albugo laibachii Nc14]
MKYLALYLANLWVNNLPINANKSESNLLFSKYRPVFHFIAESKWMNDPCGVHWNPKTEMYHMFYQLNPFDTEWGNMTWGQATSKNLAEWVDAPIALSPDSQYDSKGVFSGQAVMSSRNGVNEILLVYTGASCLPISHKIEYSHCEHVMAATTRDDGLTWQKYKEPLILYSPGDFKVTGWRDPYFFQSRSLDIALGLKPSSDETKLHMILAGGIRGAGPAVFFYSGSDFSSLIYQELLFSALPGSSFGEEAVTGNYGDNFEMTSIVELPDEDGNIFDVMLMCIENGDVHSVLWMAGSFEREDGKVVYKPAMVGIADNGIWYASTIFKDPKSENHIAFAWITEDNGRHSQPQGWNGMHALSRVLGIITIRNIYDPQNRLSVKASWVVTKREMLKCEAQTIQTSTIKTLKIVPSPELRKLRGRTTFSVPEVHLPKGGEYLLPIKSKSFEILAMVTQFAGNAEFGFKVRLSTTNTEFTKIIYNHSRRLVTIIRTDSSDMTCPEVTSEHKPATTPHHAYFEAYKIVDDTNGQCTIKFEAVKFNIFVDKSVVEVFVNDRLALSTRIYPCETASVSDGISIISNGNVKFEAIEIWADAKPAWPYRGRGPANPKS